jgi:hypothetical protein
VASSQVRSGAQSSYYVPVILLGVRWNDQRNNRGSSAGVAPAPTPRRAGVGVRTYPAGSVDPVLAGRFPTRLAVAWTLRSSVEGGSTIDRLQVPFRRTPDAGVARSNSARFASARSRSSRRRLGLARSAPWRSGVRSSRRQLQAADLFAQGKSYWDSDCMGYFTVSQLAWLL